MEPILTPTLSQRVHTIPTSKLLTWTISTPPWQRFVDPKRVQSMYDRLKHYYQWNPPIQQAITLAQVKRSPQYYIIDGQHRFQVFTKAFKQEKIDQVLLVNIIQIKNDSALIELCRFLNDSHPFQLPENMEYMEKAKQLVRNLEPILKPYLSAARKPRRPNLSLHQFTEDVVRALSRTPDCDTQKLLDAMLVFNEKCIKAPAHFFQYAKDRQVASVKRYLRLVNQKAVKHAKKQKWTQSKPCFFGMFPNGDWVDRLYSHVDQIVVPPTQPEVTRTRPKRKQFTKAERIHIWNHYVSKDARQGPCFVCEDTIRLESFECGHLEAVARGGTNALDNIRPICRICNNSCGSKNLLLFKKQSVFCK